jgi:O-antigen/teichoic acid export membrane protein
MKEFWNLFKIKINVIKDLGFIGSSNIIGTVISAVFWLYLANLLGAEGYGEIQFYIAIAGMVYIVSTLGRPNIITVYAAKNIKIHSTLFLISIIGGLISLLILFGLFGRLDIGIIILGFIIYDLSINYFLGKKQYSKYAINFLIQKGLMLCLGIGFYYIFGPEGIIFGMALSYIHFVFLSFKISRDSKIDFPLLKSKRGFIISNYLESSIGGIKGEIDKILIVPLLGFTILGNYALALQFYVVMMAVSLIVFKYLIPQDASGIQNLGLKKLTVLISILISVLSIILTPFIIPQIFPQYVDSIIAIQILSVSVPGATIGYIYVSKFLGSEKGKLVLVGRIISISSLVLGMLILPGYFGISGAAAAFVISTYCQTGFFIISKIKYLNNF